MSLTTLRSITIATSEADSTFHHQALALGEIWRDEGLVDKVTPLFTGGSVENAHLVAAGDADFGCMAANWLPLAATGKKPFTKPLAVRLMTPINSGPLFFVAAAASPLRSFADLKGKRVALGIANSGMVQHIHTQFGALGLPLETIEPRLVEPERSPPLAAALATLSPRRRLIVFLRYYADFSYAEIAAACDVTEGTVAATLAQARAALAEVLETEGVPT